MIVLINRSACAVKTSCACTGAQVTPGGSVDSGSAFAWDTLTHSASHRCARTEGPRVRWQCLVSLGYVLPGHASLALSEMHLRNRSAGRAH